ncbi:unnamed protein product [Peronospora belbahrii]|uniref:G-patch domain-containing protein n=1 Tax=Peronospora belbahrii TaxID=622444 RepID=A0AAU9KLS7_9STRA|nr:unnamed protein product [Peronospora belbahrii]CAH0521789.1 unnamed protein product [Peronospora belbahrii]
MQGNETKPYILSGTEHALDASNRGYRLLQQMGWRTGSGLGKHEQGIIEPVKMKENLIFLGLGKAEEYDKVTHLATRERRKLDTEMHETAEEIALREAKGAMKEQLREKVKSMQAAFYCSNCRKQYKSVTEMENHLSSYDHHHTKRLKDLQHQKRRVGSEEEQSMKREKEQAKEQLILQQRMTAQKQAEQVKSMDTRVPLDGVKRNFENSMTETEGGFGFGGIKIGRKKTGKKVLSGCNATLGFSNPFAQ